MKVLQISNWLYTGGAEKLLLESIPLLNEKGVQVDLALSGDVSTPFLEQLKAKNTNTIYTLKEGNKNVYNPLLIFKIIPFFKKYDIIHVHLFPPLYIVALAKLVSFSKVKLVYTEHSTSNSRRGSKLLRIFDKFIYSKYLKIITISPEVDFNLKQHLNFNPNIFELIANGVNVEAIRNEVKMKVSELHPLISQESKILLQVSSFRYPKDQKTIIRALKMLDDSVVLVLVGDGPLKKECEEFAVQKGVSDRVFFLGIRMDISKILKTADIIILSSHHEGLSLSSIEGMASGKPFVASNAPGLGDIVKDAGVLFPVGDENILAQKLENLLSDTKFYSKTVEKCLERAEQYNITENIEKTIRLYESIV